MILPGLPLSIAPDLKTPVSSVAVGWTTAAVHNSQHDEGLWQEMETI